MTDDVVVRAREHGTAAGLTDAMVNDTIRVWLDWYATQPIPVDWEVICRVMTLRSHDLPWQPPGQRT